MHKRRPKLSKKKHATAAQQGRAFLISRLVHGPRGQRRRVGGRKKTRKRERGAQGLGPKGCVHTSQPLKNTHRVRRPRSPPPPPPPPPPRRRRSRLGPALLVHPATRPILAGCLAVAVATTSGVAAAGRRRRMSRCRAAGRAVARGSGGARWRVAAAKTRRRRFQVVWRFRRGTRLFLFSEQGGAAPRKGRGGVH